MYNVVQCTLEQNQEPDENDSDLKILPIAAADTILVIPMARHTIATVKTTQMTYCNVKTSVMSSPANHL